MFLLIFRGVLTLPNAYICRTVQKIKKHSVLFSRGLLLLYVFGSLLLSFFHHHDYNNPDSQIGASGSAILVKGQENATDLDCLACHFHHNAHGALPEEFSAYFSFEILHSAPVFFHITAAHFTQLRATSLRGPPLV